MKTSLMEHLHKEWLSPDVPEQIPHGDMPGDKIDIRAEHIHKAATCDGCNGTLWG